MFNMNKMVVRGDMSLAKRLEKMHLLRINQNVTEVTNPAVKQIAIGLYKAFVYAYKFENQETIPLADNPKPHPYLIYNISMCCEEYFNNVTNYYQVRKYLRFYVFIN